MCYLSRVHELYLHVIQSQQRLVVHLLANIAATGLHPDTTLNQCSQVRDFVRRRRWIRSRVKKPAESQAGQGASTSSSPIFGHSASSFNADSRPQLSKVSTTSSTGTGPIFSRPSGMFAGHEGAPAANTSFTSQRNMNTAGQLSPPRGTGAEGVSSTGLGQSDLANLRGGSSHSLGGAMPGRSSGPEERPYMNLSDVRSGLSNECSKWGQSVASELHKAISSAGEGKPSLVVIFWLKQLLTLPSICICCDDHPGPLHCAICCRSTKVWLMCAHCMFFRL